MIISFEGQEHQFPDDAKPEEISKALSAYKPAASPTVTDQALGLAKAAGTGILKGASQLAGLPADASAALKSGSDYLAQKITGDPASPPPFDTGMKLPGGQQIEEGVGNAIGGYHQPQNTPEKYAETIGSFAPGGAIGKGGMLAKLLRFSVIPGAASEAAGQATEGTSAEPWARLGAGVTSTLVNPARAITPFPVSGLQKSFVDTLSKEGIPLTAGQKIGSERLKWAESVASGVPFGGGRSAAIEEAQGKGLTQAVMRRAGETASEASPANVDKMFSRIGGEFDRLTGSNSMGADKKLASDLGDTFKEYSQLVPENARAPIIENSIQDVIKTARDNGGQIPGETYQAIRSRLDRAARSSKADPQLSSALYGVRNSLDDAMERSLIASGKTDEVVAWQKARNEYRNALVVEKSVKGAGEDAAHGIITPGKLRTAVEQQNPRAYARGKGDFAGLARAASGTMSPLPSSGTQQRTGMHEAMQLMGIIGGLDAGGHAYGPEGAIAGGLAGLAGPAVASRLLMNPAMQKYLGNQMLKPGAPGDIQRQLLAAKLLMQTQPPQVSGQ